MPSFALNFILFYSYFIVVESGIHSANRPFSPVFFFFQSALQIARNVKMGIPARYVNVDMRYSKDWAYEPEDAAFGDVQGDTKHRKLQRVTRNV